MRNHRRDRAPATNVCSADRPERAGRDDHRQPPTTVIDGEVLVEFVCLIPDAALTA
jgi:hypothetical protein